MEIGALETRSRKKMEASSSQKRMLIAKTSNGEDILKEKMNYELSETEDETFDFLGNEPGKRNPMGSTVPFLGNPVSDLSYKYNTFLLEQEDDGKTGKTANKTDGSKIEKREDKLHMEKGQNVLENMMHLHGMKPKKMEKGMPDTNPSESALEMAKDLRKKKMKKTQRSEATDMHSVKISVLQANMTETCGKKKKIIIRKQRKGS